ncbi:MAG: hypothetical protein HHAS10_10510 [Candidatus Altimarinota bacterium]
MSETPQEVDSASEKKGEFESKIIPEWRKAEETGNYRDYLIVLDNYLQKGFIGSALTFNSELGDTMQGLSVAIDGILLDESGENYKEYIDRETIFGNGLDIDSINLFLGKSHPQVKEVAHSFARHVIGSFYHEETKH